MAQRVKHLPALQETWVRSLGQEDTLEEGMATFPNILAWRIPMDRRVWQATVHGNLQARVLEWIVFPFYRGSSPPSDATQVSCIAG